MASVSFPVSSPKKDMLLIRKMYECGCIGFREEPYILRSGQESRFYISTRNEVTDNPELEFMIGSKVAETVTTFAGDKINGKTVCLIGVPQAGANIAAATAFAALWNDKYSPICHRVMRTKRKKHGAHFSWIDGKPDQSKHAYMLVENAVTTGASVLQAAKRMADDGYNEMPPCVILVIRKAKTLVRLESKTVPIPIFTLPQVASVLNELGYWPEETVTVAETEYNK